MARLKWFASWLISDVPSELSLREISPLAMASASREARRRAVTTDRMSRNPAAPRRITERVKMIIWAGLSSVPDAYSVKR